jgi:hypothetical protein
VGSSIAQATASSEIFLICPDSKRIFRLSEAIRGALRIDSTDPAETEVDAWGDYALREAEVKVLTDAASSQTGDARAEASQEILTGLPEALSDITLSNLRWLGGKTWIHFRGMKQKTQDEITVELINAISGPLDCSILLSPKPGLNLAASIYRMASATNYEIRDWDPSLSEDWTKERPKSS